MQVVVVEVHFNHQVDDVLLVDQELEELEELLEIIEVGIVLLYFLLELLVHQILEVVEVGEGGVVMRLFPLATEVAV
jgi:hypothetical protein